MMGMVSLLAEEETSLPHILSLCLSLSPYHVRIQQEGSYLQARNQALTRRQICQHLNHVPHNLQNGDKQSYLFKPAS